MPKIKAYVRIAKGNSGKYKIDARGTHPHYAPIYDSHNAPLPTVAFAVEFVIPDHAFHQAKQVIAEITIPEDQLQIAAEVAEVAQ